MKAVTKAEQERLTEEFIRIGKENAMTIRLCCENVALEKYGADISGCMTQEVIEEAKQVSWRDGQISLFDIL